MQKCRGVVIRAKQRIGCYLVSATVAIAALFDRSALELDGRHIVAALRASMRSSLAHPQKLPSHASKQSPEHWKHHGPLCCTTSTPASISSAHTVTLELFRLTRSLPRLHAHSPHTWLTSARSSKRSIPPPGLPRCRSLSPALCRKSWSSSPDFQALFFLKHG